MSKTVKLKAYAAGNLGDDLFIQLICRRYPDVTFYLCGARRFRAIYCGIPNLKYICYDTAGIRLWMAMRRAVTSGINRMLGYEGYRSVTTDAAVEEKYSKKSDYNVYIIGSGFMNGPDELISLPQKFKEEERFYKRHPYLIGCNFGPYAYQEYLEMYRELFQYTADLCFRDSYSLSLFPMIKHARWAADIVFGYPVEAALKETPLIQETYLLISVANLKKDRDDAEKYDEDYVLMLRRLVKSRNDHRQHTVLVGFSREQQDDKKITQVLAGIQNPELNHIFNYPDISCSQMLRLFMDAECVVATRYHAMVLALMLRKKVCAICYNEKIRHVLEDIAPEAPYVTLEDLRNLEPVQIVTEKMFEIREDALQSLTDSADKHFRELDKALRSKRKEHTG